MILFVLLKPVHACEPFGAFLCMLFTCVCGRMCWASGKRVDEQKSVPMNHMPRESELNVADKTR